MTTSSSKSPIYWPVVLSAAFYNFVSWLDGDVFVAVIRTRIQCGVTGTETEFCAQSPDSCVSRSPQDPSWSGSLYCFDKTYVLGETAKCSATITAWAVALAFVATPIFGGLADVYGRKNIILFAFLGCVVNLIASWLAFMVPLSQALLWLTLGALLFPVFGAGMRGACMAMAADMSESTVEQRGVAMAALQMGQVVSNLLAYAFGFVILLQNLTDYRWVFVAFALASAGFGIFSGFLLEETLPAAPARELAESKQISDSKGFWENFRNGLRILYADKLLMGLLPVAFLAALAHSGVTSILAVFLMAEFQYSQAVASLSGVFVQPFMFAGNLLSSYLMKWVGPEKAFYTGILLAAFAYSMMGVCMCFHNIIVSQVTWWLGFGMTGVSLGIHDVATGTLISMRVKEQHQSKIIGFTLQCSVLGTFVGTYVWGDVIFDPAAKGLAAGNCFLWSSSVGFAAGILFLVVMKFTNAREGELKSLQSGGSSYGSH